jgi:hypothetical protein
MSKKHDDLVSNGKLLAKMLSSFGKLSCTETLQSDEDYASFADQWFRENENNPILSEGVHHLVDSCKNQN